MNLEQIKGSLIEIVERPLIGEGNAYAESINANREEMAAWSIGLHENWPSPEEVALPEWVEFIDTAKVAHSYVMDGKRDQHQRDFLIAKGFLQP